MRASQMRFGAWSGIEGSDSSVAKAPSADQASRSGGVGNSEAGLG